LYCGRALSQTGGHADQREPGENFLYSDADPGMGVLCDGVPAVRQACRNEIRKGAHHIKLMLSGGVVSPTDRIANLQFSEDEIKAAVEEARMAGLYCSGHTYTAEAVNRAIKCGVRSLEHCNLINESSIELFLKYTAYMVPTLSTYEALAEHGIEAGIPESIIGKLHQVRDAGAAALTLADEAGVKIVYGTDLLGSMQQYQLNEFKIRSKIQSPIDVIRSATTVAADLFNKQGQIGIVAEGAYADLLVVDGNPLDDINVMTKPETYLKAIMKRGIIVKNTLS
jgi:imidazolonepropionase-like amidohydrolase